MGKQTEEEQMKKPCRSANEELQLSEEYLLKMGEKEEQLRKEGFSGLSLYIQLFGPIIDRDKFGITDEMIAKWDEEEEQWRKEGLSEFEIVERRFSPFIDDSILWE